MHSFDPQETARQWIRILEILAAVVAAGFVYFRYFVWDAARQGTPIGYSLKMERRLWIMVLLLYGSTGSVEFWGQASSSVMPESLGPWKLALHWLTSTWAGAAAGLRPILSALLLASAYASFPSRKIETGLKTSLILLLVALFPITGHANETLTGTAIAFLTHLLHMLLAAVWFGGLSGLFAATFVRHQTVAHLTEWNRMLRRFSRAALPSLLLLAASGIQLAWMRLTSVSDLWNSAYGQILLFKLGLITLVFLIACLHRFRFMPRLNTIVQEQNLKDLPKLSGFLTGMRLEIAIGFAAIAAAGMLSTTAPPEGNGLKQSIYWHEMGVQAHMSLRIKQQARSEQQLRLDVWLPSGLGAPVRVDVRVSNDGEPASAEHQVPLMLTQGGPDPYGFEGFDKYTYESVDDRMLIDEPGNWDVLVDIIDPAMHKHVYHKTIEHR
ncbi:copper resistance D family protein [Paenibacillus sp. y28]|uniref:copper resistance D family protein n=1 Tax=Paenibacillus sp. y28 TaxID=3129110 RepID=UPI003019371A